MDALGFETHDHAHCIADTVALVEKRCLDSGLQLTAVRKRTLEIMLEEHRALGAYDVLARLSEEGFGSQPPVAYRALDFLSKNGFVHKIERLNAFVACAYPHADHSPAFLICRACHLVAEAETEPARGMLAKIAASSDFVIERAVLEAEGLCPTCRKQETPT